MGDSERASANPAQPRIRRRLVGIAALAALAGLFVMLLSALPSAAPRLAQPAETPSNLPVGPASHLPLGSTHPTPFGQTALLPEIEDNPKKALESRSQETLSGPNAEDEPDQAGRQTPRANAAILSVRIDSARVLSADAFEEWFPLYAQTGGTTPTYPGDEIVVFAEVQAENLGDAPLDLPLPCLRSPLLRGDQSLAGTAIPSGIDELSALYGQEGPHGLTTVPDDTFRLAAGESTTFPFAFRVYRNQLSDPAALDAATPEDFAVGFIDYGELSLYELALS